MRMSTLSPLSKLTAPRYIMPDIYIFIVSRVALRKADTGEGWGNQQVAAANVTVLPKPSCGMCRKLGFLAVWVLRLPLQSPPPTPQLPP